MDKNIDTVVTQLFEDEVILADTNEESAVVDLQQTLENDYSIQYKCSGGAGTADIEILESVNGEDWETNGTPIGSGLTASDTGLVKFTAGVGAAFIKVFVTETGKSDPITVNIWICTR